MKVGGSRCRLLTRAEAVAIQNNNNINNNTNNNNNNNSTAGKYVPPGKRAAQLEAEKAAAAQKEKREAAAQARANAAAAASAAPAAPRGPSKWAEKGDDVPSSRDFHDRDRGDRGDRGYGGDRDRDRDHRGGGGGGGGFDRRGGNNNSSNGRFSGKGGSGDYRNDGYGGDTAFDELGARNERVERELFGDATENAEKAMAINFSKYDDIPVEMSGNNAPLPINTWDDEDLGPVVENAIKLAGYSRPTPVQRYAIPVIVAQRDLMACAQTGSGSKFPLWRVCVFFFFFLSRKKKKKKIC